jgi:hypothetical protein
MSNLVFAKSLLVSDNMLHDLFNLTLLKTDMSEMSLKNNMIKPIPFGLIKCSSLITLLDLSGNDIETFENGFLRPTRIYELSMKNNSLTLVTNTAFIQLRSIRYLDLSQNKLSTLTV